MDSSYYTAISPADQIRYDALVRAENAVRRIYENYEQEQNPDSRGENVISSCGR